MLARELDHVQVQRILNGEDTLWDVLYESAYPAVLRCARQADPQKLLSHAEYCDIADEAFARCYADLRKYEGRSRFAYWVGRYAKNIAMDRCDKVFVRRRNMPASKAAVKQHIINSDPMLVLICREERRCLWYAFSALPPMEQDILELRALHKKTFREIGETLCISRAEAMRRYRSAVNETRIRYKASRKRSIWR